VEEDYEVVITFLEPVKKLVRPPFEYDSMTGYLMSDDFDAPLEDMKEYMQG